MSEMTDEILLSAIPELTGEQVDRFRVYFDMLVDWNTRINLTRIVEPQEVAAKHFADSVLGSGLIKNGARVVDIGTGAGFPGIPIAIMRPDIELVLVDSLAKRIGFLDEVIKSLGIPAKTMHARAEDAARMNGMREGFDIALSRAVAPMNVLLELTTPFIKVGGSSLMYKAASVNDEIEESKNALKELKCKLIPHEYDVEWGQRSIVEAVKLGHTDKKYPRKAGTAQKKPL